MISVYNCFLLPNSHLFSPVTHDLDVVVKGNLSLFRIKISNWAPPTCSQMPKMCVCVFACVHVGHTFSDGCPGLCSGHGRCTLEQSGWRCVCQTGWSGPGCSVVMETDCSDGTDNDGGDILTSSIIFYLFFSVLLLSFLSFWQIVHSIPLLLLLFLLPKNLPHCSSPSSLCAVQVLLRLL